MESEIEAAVSSLLFREKENYDKLGVKIDSNLIEDQTSKQLK
jgi:hypothetical protein